MPRRHSSKRKSRHRSSSPTAADEACAAASSQRRRSERPLPSTFDGQPVDRRVPEAQPAAAAASSSRPSKSSALLYHHALQSILPFLATGGSMFVANYGPLRRDDHDACKSLVRFLCVSRSWCAAARDLACLQLQVRPERPSDLPDRLGPIAERHVSSLNLANGTMAAAELTRFAHLLPRLRELRIRVLPDVLTYSSFSVLRTLHLCLGEYNADSGVTMAQLQAQICTIGTLTRLESLQLEMRCSALPAGDPVSFEAWSGLTQLHTFEMNVLWMYSTEATRSYQRLQQRVASKLDLPLFPALRSMPSLTSLSLHRPVTPAVLEALFTPESDLAGRLRHIDWETTQFLSAHLPFLHQLTGLTSLKIFCGRGEVDELADPDSFANALEQGCASKLRRLEIGGPHPLLGVNSLRRLLSACSSLEDLYLRGCPSTDVSWLTTAVPYFSASLRKLTLHFGILVAYSPADLLQLCLPLQRLEFLTLCAAFPDGEKYPPFVATVPKDLMREWTDSCRPFVPPSSVMPRLQYLRVQEARCDAQGDWATCAALRELGRKTDTGCELLVKQR